MFKIKIAFCGDDCSYCPRYHLNLKNNKKDLTKIATLFMKVEWRDNIKPLETVNAWDVTYFKEFVNIISGNVV